MLRSFPFVLLLILLPLVRCASAQQLNDTVKADKIRAEVTRRISSKKERVTVKLQSGNEVKGSLAQAGADTFTVTDPKTGQQTSIAYTEVAKVNGGGLSKWTKIGIVIGVGVVVVAVVAAVSLRHFDPFEHGILIPR
jgi:hypothetical protein